MATVKISGLPAASAVVDANEFEINEAGTSKKVTGSQISSHTLSKLDGDKGDITVSSNGTVWTIDNEAVNLTTKVTGTLPVANGGTGATTLTANNVILGNGTSAVQFVAAGTSGNVLTSNGTTWTSAAATSGGYDVQTFTSSGTWTKPTSAPADAKVFIDIVHGGSSGACRATTGNAAGGVSGGLTRLSFPLSRLAATETVVIGAGGDSVSGVNSNGNIGGASSFTVNGASVSRVAAVVGGTLNAGTGTGVQGFSYDPPKVTVDGLGVTNIDFYSGSGGEISTSNTNVQRNIQGSEGTGGGGPSSSSTNLTTAMRTGGFGAIASGGNGGAATGSSNGQAGEFPGGGGGAAVNGGASGAGGNGQVTVTVIW